MLFFQLTVVNLTLWRYYFAMSQSAIFSHRIQITPTTWSYFFTPNSPVLFLPGQYLRWTAPIDRNIERGNNRFFTISSLPGENMISFTTRFLESISPFKAFLQVLEPGDALDISKPMGDFTLPNDAAIPVVMLAGGIGVTPFRSMIATSVSSYSDRTILLVHSAKKAAELAFRQEFEQLASNFPHLNIRYFVEEADDSTIRGNILVSEIITEALAGSIYYISGPEPFVDAMQTDLIAGGVKAHDIKTDYFPGYNEI